jgi:hypothetical protein
MHIEELTRTMMDDHAELLAALRGVEAMVESSTPATGDLARRLDELTALLRSHIAEEEASPLYVEYAKRDPELGEELQRLKAGHPDLLAELRSLSRACDAAPRLPLGGKLSIRIRKAVASLREHEAAEADAMRRIAMR